MNFMQMMQQAKAMQGKVAEMQERMGYELVEGMAGGGAVKIVMTCKGRVEAVRIDKSAVDAGDTSLLEDLVKAAMNDGRTKGEDRMADETKRMMEELGLPANAKLPF